MLLMHWNYSAYGVRSEVFSVSSVFAVKWEVLRPSVCNRKRNGYSICFLKASTATFMPIICRDICHKTWHFDFSVHESILVVSPPVVFVSNLPSGLSNVLCCSKIAGRGTQSWLNRGAIQCRRLAIFSEICFFTLLDMTSLHAFFHFYILPPSLSPVDWF